MRFTVMTFYKYVPLEEPAAVKNWLTDLCLKHDLLGRVLLGAEGVNAGVCGLDEDIESFKQDLKGDARFSDITFRELPCDKNCYHKLVVRVRDEIVAFGKKVDLEKRGKHISPKAFKELLDEGEDIVILDARNDYEVKVGRFKGALTLPIKTFKEFADHAPSLEQFKDRKIVMYCTGGIRCEKASALLRSQGFSDVSQLQGGIIEFCKRYPNADYEGSLYVYDDRQVADMGSDGSISSCELCHKPSDSYVDCSNLDCDRLFIACDGCQDEFKRACSPACRDAPRKRYAKVVTPPLVVGRVENYYAKAKVALVRLRKRLVKGARIAVKGRTTSTASCEVNELRDAHGNQIERAPAGTLVTFPMETKVRPKDVVVLSC